MLDRIHVVFTSYYWFLFLRYSINFIFYFYYFYSFTICLSGIIFVNEKYPYIYHFYCSNVIHTFCSLSLEAKNINFIEFEIIDLLLSIFFFSLFFIGCCMHVCNTIFSIYELDINHIPYSVREIESLHFYWQCSS